MTPDQMRAAIQSDLANAAASFFWLRVPSKQRKRAEAVALYFAQAGDVEINKLIALDAHLTEEPVMKSDPVLKQSAVDALTRAGFDINSINWQKVFAILQALLQILLAQQTKALAAGCPEHDALMHETAKLCLQAAANCLTCCQDQVP